MKTKDWTLLRQRQSIALPLVSLFFKTTYRSAQVEDRRKTKLLAAILAGLCLWTLTAHAQTWVGGTMATSPPAAPGSFSWNTPTNWSNPAAIPVAGGTAFFNAATPKSISTLGGVSVGSLFFTAPN